LHSRFADHAQVERAFTVYTKKLSPTAADLTTKFKKEHLKSSVDGYMNNAKSLPKKYRLLVLARLSSTGSVITIKQEPDARARPSAPTATVQNTRGQLFVPSSDPEDNKDSGASEDEEDSGASEESAGDGGSRGSSESDDSGRSADSDSDDSSADENIKYNGASEDDDSSRSEDTDGNGASGKDNGSTIDDDYGSKSERNTGVRAPVVQAARNRLARK
jgi:hypothetical protein